MFDCINKWGIEFNLRVVYHRIVEKISLSDNNNKKIIVTISCIDKFQMSSTHKRRIGRKGTNINFNVLFNRVFYIYNAFEHWSFRVRQYLFSTFFPQQPIKMHISHRCTIVLLLFHVSHQKHCDRQYFFTKLSNMYYLLLVNNHLCYFMLPQPTRELKSARLSFFISENILKPPFNTKKAHKLNHKTHSL